MISRLGLWRRLSSLARPGGGLNSTGVSTDEWRVVDDQIAKISSTKPLSPAHSDVWKDLSGVATARLDTSPPNNTYSGRSVTVTEGKLGAAFAELDKILAQNKVRMYLRQTARYEKPGEKRRRLRSERWRAIFANEVRKNVQLATKIRNRAG